MRQNRTAIEQAKGKGCEDRCKHIYWQAVDISGARIYRQRTDEIMHSKRVHVRGYLLLDDDY